MVDHYWQFLHEDDNSERREPTAKPLALEESSIDNMYVREKGELETQNFYTYQS